MFYFKKNIKALLILGLLFLPVFAFAQTRATIDVSIPCISCKYATTTSPVGVIANFYELAIALSGVLALGMIIYAGILRVTGASSPKNVSESNDIIYNALLGIVLLFGAYVLLNTINPQLTQLEIPALSKIEIPVTATMVYDYQCNEDSEGIKVKSCHLTMDDCVSKCGAEAATRCKKVASCRVSGNGACPIAPFTPLTDPEAIAMENLAKQNIAVQWTSPNPTTQSNLNKLHVEADKYVAALRAAGASGAINSAFRPQAYQSHLYEIYDINQKLKSLTPSQKNDCISLENEFKAETNIHKICGSYRVCYVSKGAGVHSRGTGVDIGVTGIAQSEYQAFLDSRGIKLSWYGAGDVVHYNLKQ